MLLAERLELVIGCAESVAHAIGALEVANPSGAGPCAVALARALSAAGPLASKFTYSAPDGAVWCSAVPHVSPQSAQHGLARGAPAGSAADRRRLLSVPILDARGEVKAVATAALNGPAMTRGLLPDVGRPVMYRGQPVLSIRRGGRAQPRGPGARLAHSLDVVLQTTPEGNVLAANPGRREQPRIEVRAVDTGSGVQRHGGRIWAEGRPGVGPAFYFELGAQEEPSTPPPAPPAFADSRRGAA